MNLLCSVANFTDHKKLPGFQAGDWGQDGGRWEEQRRRGTKREKFLVEAGGE